MAGPVRVAPGRPSSPSEGHGGRPSTTSAGLAAGAGGTSKSPPRPPPRAARELDDVPAALVAPELSVDGPFAVDVLFTRDRAGGLALVVCAKLTARLLPDECALDTPSPVLRSDEPERGQRAQGDALVRRPRDLVPVRYAPEVVVVGSAFCPRPAEHVLARVAVAGVDAAVEVWGERALRSDGTLDKSAPSTRFSLDLSGSSGGPGTENPWGIDPDSHDLRGRRCLPRVVPPLCYSTVHDPAQVEFVPLVTLGPLPASAPLRAERLREGDARWIEAPHEGPEPAELDVRYFQAALPTQWASRPFVGDEWLVLEGLHPRAPRLATRLPGLEPRVLVDGRVVEMQGELLVIDTDAGLVTLTFRGRTSLEGGRASRLVVQPFEDAEATRDHEPTRSLAGDDLDLDALERTNLPPARASRALADDALPFPERRAPAPRPSRGSMDDALPFRETGASPSAMPALKAPAAAGPAPPPLVGTLLVTAPPPSLVGASNAALDALPPQAAHGVEAHEPKTGPISTLGVLPGLPEASHVPTSHTSHASHVSTSHTSHASHASTGHVAASHVAASHTSHAAHTSHAGHTSSKASAEGDGAAPRERVGARPSTFGAAFGLARAAAPPRDEASPRSELRVEPSRELAPSAREASDRAAKAVATRAPRATRAHASERDDHPRLRAIDLWGFDPALPARLRRPPFAELLRALERPSPVRLDEPAREPDPSEQARLDVLRALSFGPARELPAVRALLDAALFGDARELDLEPPLALVAGEARASFDEVEVLRATVAAAQPLAPSDKRLAQAVTLASESLGSPSPPAGELALGLARPIEQAMQAMSLPARYLERQVERTLLEQRKLRRRTLFGAPRFRVDLVVGGETLPCYLDEGWLARWPLLAAVPLVVLGELRPREDASEASTECFVARAAGRTLAQR